MSKPLPTPGERNQPLPELDRTQRQGESPTADLSDAPTGTSASAQSNTVNVPEFPFLSPPQQSDEIGRLGDYRILKKLGEGGMGFVFRGEEVSLQRIVALKVMRPEVASKPQATERFLREGRAAAGLRSDHIITVYAASQANGVPFLAMEYLEGLPLDEWIKSQKKAIPLPHVLRLIRDTLRGLAVAHEKGLVHRDIKPANLWLEKATSRIKILDFGLTRSNASDEHLTLEGAVVGTPSYMAPEQACGKPTDPRADVFSVGTVMYTMLAGKNPFARGNLMATLAAVGFNTLPPICTLRPDVPGEYSAFLDHLLAKRPEDRPTDAKAALQELTAIEKKLVAATKAVNESALGVKAVPATPVPGPTDCWNEITADTPAPKYEPAVPAVTPARRKSKAFWVALGVGFAALVAAVGAVIVITHKDGTQTIVTVPDGAKVEIQLNSPPPKSAPKKSPSPPTPSPSPSPPAASPPAASPPPATRPPAGTDANRRVAELVLSRGGGVTLTSNPTTIIWRNDALPAGPFECHSVIINLTRPFTDEDFTLLDSVPSLVGVELPPHAGPPTQRSKEFLQALSRLPLAKRLTVLRLPNADLDNDSVRLVARFPALTFLDLFCSVKVTDEAVEHLRGLKLTGIRLDRTSVGDVGVIKLVTLFPDLNILQLAGSKVTDAGLKDIHKLPNLRWLWLERCDITDAGVKHLLGSPLLRILSLDYTNITPAALDMLGRLQLNNLHVVQDGTRFTPTDADLTKLDRSDRLTQLTINSGDITDAGVMSLTKHKRLSWVRISGPSKITSAGIQQFKTALPGCSFEVNQPQ